MFELLIALFTAGGATGFGSILKIGGGLIDSYNHKREIKAETRLRHEARKAGHDVNFQKEVMSNEYALHTRRMLALNGMRTLSFITIFSTIFCDIELTTFAREAGSIKVLFLFEYPIEAQIVTITLGHIALVAATVIYPMIIGFYFTPGGRR
jgi:hypothetical protein